MRRIKAVAHELGFSARLEAQVGDGGADLVLERDGSSIAVEISVTTGVTHEMENVLKCLNGSFTHIAFVTADTKKQEQVRERVLARVSEKDAARVGFYQVETFIDFLRNLPNPVARVDPAPASAKPANRKVGNWTVKSKFAEQTPEEARTREEAAINAIAEMLRKSPT